MKILFRADGGTGIGMGHVMRSTVLADKLKEFAEVVFVCKDHLEYQPGIDYIKAKGYTVICIDRSQVLRALEEIEGDCLITDSYDVNEEYFYLTSRLYKTTGYIDDLNLYRLEVDFIINQNVYAAELKYSTKSNTALFLGSEYALLREEFQGLPKRNIRNDIQSIMVTMGGADPDNITGAIIKHLMENLPGIQIHVVIGPSFLHRLQLETMYRAHVFLHHNPKMSELMLECDVAVSACGSTLYELAACGTPTIGMVIADNQRLGAQKMNSMGIICLAEKTADLAGCIKRMNFEKRKAMSMAARNLVDGMGSMRLAAGIRKVVLNSADKA